MNIIWTKKGNIMKSHGSLWGEKMEMVHRILKKNALIILLPKCIKYFSQVVALLESCVLVQDGQRLWVNVQEQMPHLWPVCLLLTSHFRETLLICKQQSTEVELWCIVLDINIYIYIKLRSILFIFNHNPKCYVIILFCFMAGIVLCRKDWEFICKIYVCISPCLWD